MSYNFRNYEYSQLLTEMETDTLIGLCSFYAPDKLERRVIFQVNDTLFVAHEILVRFELAQNLLYYLASKQETCLGGLRTTKTQTSLRIRAV